MKITLSEKEVERLQVILEVEIERIKKMIATEQHDADYEMNVMYMEQALALTRNMRKMLDA